MSRIVGDSPDYVFDLRTPRGPSPVHSISLPSVTTILGRVINKPQLTAWMYRQTVDVVSGAVSYLRGVLPDSEILDSIDDPEALDQWLRDNRLRPDDTKSEAAERGRREHELLERLTLAQLAGQDEDVDLAAQALDRVPPDYAAAIGAWWLETKPQVVESEKVVWCLEPHGGYAGTLDLVTSGAPESGGVGGAAYNGSLKVLDLKTRKAGSRAYASDLIQVAFYARAYEAMTGNPVDRKTVLVARADGTYEEYESRVSPGIVDSLLAVHRELERAEGR